MRTFILTAARCMFAVLLGFAVAAGGQYIKIETMDAESAFPRVDVHISAHLPSKAPIRENSLSLYEDGSRAGGRITLVPQPGPDKRLSLVILIDSSRSITKKFLAFAKQSAKDLAKASGPHANIAVYRFNDTVRLLNDFSGNEDEIRKHINSIRRRGTRTHLYDAITDAIRLSDKMENGKIVVYTDGKDEGSCITEGALVRNAKDAGFPVYFIFPASTRRTKLLERISNLTGGMAAYRPDRTCMADIFRAVRSAGAHDYLLSYTTSLKPDGRLHTIEIMLKQGRVSGFDRATFRTPHERFDVLALLSGNNVLIGVLVLIGVILLAAVLVLLYREKKYFKKIFEIEKKLSADRTAPGPDAQAYGLWRIRTPSMEEDPDSMYENAWLFQKNGPDAGRKLPIHLREVTIGRKRSNHIILNDDAVSDVHARITNRNGAYYLYDLLSERGVYLNGKKLLRPKQLYDWDEITLGETRLIFRGSQTIR
jgi:VWFA-related protein